MIDVAGAVAVEAVDEQTRDRPDPAHAAAGVRSVAAHYGDPAREQRALDTGVGLVDRSHRDVVAVTGGERVGWLHTLTTQYLTDLKAGEGTELLVLSPHGHVERHATVAEDGETTWLDTEPSGAAGLLDYLLGMRFFTRAEPVDVTPQWALLSLVGPDSGDALGALGVDVPAAPDVLPVPGAKFAKGSVPARPTARYDVRPLPDGGWARRGRLGIDLLVPRAALSGVAGRLMAAGVPAAGLWAYEAVRVAARLPRLNFETDHRTIPAEVDPLLAAAVHLDKGCYRGQETVARVHNLGRAPRRLVLLHLDGITTDALPAPGTPVTLADRPVGFTGTAVRHHELGPIALAVVKRNVPDDAALLIDGTAAAIDEG